MANPVTNRDQATGLTYAQARYYNPVTARFLAPDPVGFASGGPGYFNRYAYTMNDPVNYWDPHGEDRITVGFEFKLALFGGARATLAASYDTDHRQASVHAAGEASIGLQVGAKGSFFGGVSESPSTASGSTHSAQLVGTASAEAELNLVGMNPSAGSETANGYAVEFDGLGWMSGGEISEVIEEWAPTAGVSTPLARPEDLTEIGLGVNVGLKVGVELRETITINVDDIFGSEQ